MEVTLTVVQLIIHVYEPSVLKIQIGEVDFSWVKEIVDVLHQIPCFESPLLEKGHCITEKLFYNTINKSV